MSRLPALVLIVLAAGCARERVKYEVALTSEPVARRTPRRSHREAFPATAYVHGDPRHRCDARCDTYWPDVYAHGSPDHHCDTSCDAYRAPPARRQQGRTAGYGSYQRPTYVASPLTTPGSSTSGVRVSVARSDDARSRADDVRDATPSAPVALTAYAHGHARHRCDSSCGRSTVVVSSHGHARHRCTTTCGAYSWPHGHVRHRCGASCDVHDDPHGHARHGCSSLCHASAGVALRTANGRLELRIGGDRAHGDRYHACSAACSYFTPPSAFYAHGHRLHACGRGCGLFNAVVSPRRHVDPVRHGRAWTDPRRARIDDRVTYGGRSHTWRSHGAHVSDRVSRGRSAHDHLRSAHRSRVQQRSSQGRARGGIDLGFGLRLR